MAVASDTIAGDPAASVPGIYLCLWDGFDGAWGGDVDSPTTGVINNIAAYAEFAVIEVADDFNAANNIFVGIDGSGPPAAGADDIWRIAGRSTVTGPSLVQARNLVGTGAARISDMQFIGSASTGALYVGCEFPVGTTHPIVNDGQAQVFRGESMTLWGTWTPSFKPPSGAWPVSIDLMGETLMAAGGGEGFTTSGLHRCAAGCTACAAGQRMVFNGVGLLDDIAVSEDIPGYANPGVWPRGVPLMLGTTWCLAEAVAEEVSPTYATDNLMYVSTFSEWNHNDVTTTEVRQHMTELSLWRWTDGMHWERVLYEHLTLPVDGPNVGVPVLATGYAQYRGKPMLTVAGQGYFYNDWTWWPRVSDTFSEDPYVFLLGGRGDSTTGGVDTWWEEMLWYSPDKGDTWINVLQMPLGALDLVPPLPVFPSGAGLSETGWFVEDNNVVFLGDVAGWIYKTVDRGAAWSEGALTAYGLEISDIITSPIYSETGESDQVVLVGTFDGNPRNVFGFAPNLPVIASDLKSEVWVSQDGCEQDLENVGAELDTDPGWPADESDAANAAQAFGNPQVNFDINWETNGMAYGAAGGWLDRWQLVGPGAVELTRIDTTDVGVYRTEINLNDPSASTWEQVYDADDFEAITKDPQPYPQMDVGVPPGPKENVYRAVFLSDLTIGADGTAYVPYAIWDASFNTWRRPPEPPSPMPWPNNAGPWVISVPSGYGRFTNGGVLRMLDGTESVPNIAPVRTGLGEWDGLWLNRAPVGASNILISLAWDWQEWRFKLAIYDDTLSGGATALGPASGSTGAGSLVGNTVQVPLSWADLDATVYEWQVDTDSGFTPPVVASGTTSQPAVTVTGLEPGVKYYWRTRALEPAMGRWSEPSSFTTVQTAATNAPELISPEAGAYVKDNTPSFQWSKLGWADKYDIQVATDAGFGTAALVINENLGDVQAYEAEIELDEGTTYFWRVGANSDNPPTRWSATGTFTIGEAPGEGGTAGWVWALIVIGIVLIVLMLMLIMRTRRPA
jgi:hypothetical protein